MFSGGFFFAKTLKHWFTWMFTYEMVVGVWFMVILFGGEYFPFLCCPLGTFTCG